MVTPTPTGRLVPTDYGFDLVLTRSLPVARQEAWVNITDPERTARWIGQWQGNGTIGEIAQLQLGFEADAPWANFRLAECEAPHRLRIETLDGDANAVWDLAVDLTGSSEPTDLVFTMSGIDPSSVGQVGPGWEYYLDQLVASLRDAPLPKFRDYYPAQQEYFQAQAR
jgi:uncharacterized protein YndB with AHSA1/START domain